ncbi:hypothetical protein CY34DRAFT_149748 [Suillus luteus UH-Slu-Lm8-n1]|uniref:Uncharacterized protein n=1 Tax=Suillus luteus UH-Slu-Lm8-n1 TaxID=930992 RepID=A0A0D0BDT6_9AGAM|nr:hypothetical protein CY34DRAFT_149748 [Suillus luteus UH-Slu-Lm8-n1]
MMIMSDYIRGSTMTTWHSGYYIFEGLSTNQKSDFSDNTDGDDRSPLRIYKRAWRPVLRQRTQCPGWHSCHCTVAPVQLMTCTTSWVIDLTSQANNFISGTQVASEPSP